MPYADPQTAAVSHRERQRRYRARVKAGAAVQVPMPQDTPSGDLVDAVASWATSTLKVPSGHPLAGQAMEIPAYGVSFLRDVMGDGVREGLLCTGRKNGKSAIIACFVLALLAGPLRRPGLRIGTCSVNREKAGELLRHCKEIAEASGLKGLEFMRTPAPGLIRASADSSAEFLSADKSAGHASGFDWAIIDELGLMTERDRELIAGMRTSTSARNGRLIALSIRGDSPMLEEMIERRDLPTCSVHLFAPDAHQGDDVDVADPAIWAAGNPGLRVGIKSGTYMEAEAARVLATPSDLGSFLAYDLNLPQAPSREMIFSPTDLVGCQVDVLPDREGPCFVGLDCGEATSGTAAAAIWPRSGRCEFWFAFGDVPSLAERGRVDGSRYEEMARRGELTTYPGRVTPVAAFLEDLAIALAGADVRSLAADGYKDAEVRDYLEKAGLAWQVSFRHVGAGKDGGRDVRALQRLVLNRKLRLSENLALASAIGASAIRRDGNGNPGLDKAKQKGRIDLLSAFVIAAGLAEPEFDRPAQELRIFVV